MAALTDAIAGALLLYGTVDRVVHLSCSAAIDEVPPGVIKARLQWQVEQLVSAEVERWPGRARREKGSPHADTHAPRRSPSCCLATLFSAPPSPSRLPA